jgi:hypothetical protein
MNSFVTRVELHGAGQQDYDNLHRYMAEARFRRTITDDDGVDYQLPTATYYSRGVLSAQDVRTLAKGAANRTGRPSWVMVTEERFSCWELVPVRASTARSLPPPPPVNALRSPLSTLLVENALTGLYLRR